MPTLLPVQKEYIKLSKCGPKITLVNRKSANLWTSICGPNHLVICGLITSVPDPACRKFCPDSNPDSTLDSNPGFESGAG
jgi:hypothetical protein